MNCGLANIRAREVARLLRSEPAVDDRGSKGHRCVPRTQSRSQTARRPSRDSPAFKQAKRIRKLLTGFCGDSSSSSNSSNTTQSAAGLSTEVHAWDDDPENDWSWFPNAKTGVLDRSAHIALQGIDHLDKCPQLLRGHFLPLRVDDSPG